MKGIKHALSALLLMALISTACKHKDAANGTTASEGLQFEASSTLIDSVYSLTYVNVSGDTGYLLDSTTYKGGQIQVIRTADMDSATFMAYMLADSTTSVTMKSTYTLGYNKWAAQLVAVQTEKTQDSSRMVAYDSRLTQASVVIDSIIAN